MGNRRAAIADTKIMTKSLNNKKYDKELFTPGSWFFEESNIGKKSSNQYQGRSNNYPGINISNINHKLFFAFLNLKAITKNNIPKITSSVKSHTLNGSDFSEKAGTINAAPNQPADKLTNKSEIIENQIGSVFIINNLA